MYSPLDKVCRGPCVFVFFNSKQMKSDQCSVRWATLLYLLSAVMAGAAAGFTVLTIRDTADFTLVPGSVIHCTVTYTVMEDLSVPNSTRQRHRALNHSPRWTHRQLEKGLDSTVRCSHDTTAVSQQVHSVSLCIPQGQTQTRETKQSKLNYKMCWVIVSEPDTDKKIM